MARPLTDGFFYLPDCLLWQWDWTGPIMLICWFLVSHLNFLFVPCGGLSWLPVSFLLHVKYTLSYRIVSYRMAATTVEWSSFLPSTNSLCFSSARRHYNKTCQVRVLHRLWWKCNCSCVLSRLRNKSSKFYKISSLLKNCAKNFLALLFRGHSVYAIFTGWLIKNVPNFVVMLCCSTIELSNHSRTVAYKKL